MKLLTKVIEKQLEKAPIYSTEKMEWKPVVVKFFTPDSSWTWYVVEGARTEDYDWEFFGLVDGHKKEWGYFRLSELLGARGGLGLPVERDMYFEGYEASSTTNEIRKRA